MSSLPYRVTSLASGPPNHAVDPIYAHPLSADNVLLPQRYKCTPPKLLNKVPWVQTESDLLSTGNDGLPGNHQLLRTAF